MGSLLILLESLWLLNLQKTDHLLYGEYSRTLRPSPKSAHITPITDNPWRCPYSGDSLGQQMVSLSQPLQVKSVESKQRLL